jgi:hypothetical protein
MGKVTPSQKQTKSKRAGGMAQMVELLSSPEFNLHTRRKRSRRKKGWGGGGRKKRMQIKFFTLAIFAQHKEKS